MKDCTVIVPIYNEKPEVVVALYDQLSALGYPVIVINDGDTVSLPEGINQIRYVPNVGYGFALKQGILHAKTSLVCTMDGDGQHLPSDVEKLYKTYQLITDCKMLIGTRWGLKEKFLRKLGRKVLNFLATIISQHYMVDLNSGLRILDRNLALSYEPILCNTFSFTTSLTMAYVTDGYKFGWFPIDVKPRVYGCSTVKVIKDGLVTLKYILWVGIALRTRRLREWLRKKSL